MRAFLIDLLSVLIVLFLESFLSLAFLRTFLLGTFGQTTRVLPGFFLSRALNSLRSAGTEPPAAGLTEVSGAGSGQ